MEKMKFYSVTNIETGYITVFRTEEFLRSSKDIVKYAVEKQIVPGNVKAYSGKVGSEECYITFLTEKMADVLCNEFDEFKSKLSGSSIDDICRRADEISARNDIIYILCDFISEEFRYQALEKWLENPKEMAAVIYDKVFGIDHSDENEKLVSIINREWEAN